MIFPAVSRRTIHVYRGELRDIATLLFRGQFIKGNFVGVFEKAFGQYIGSDYAVATGSGRLALFAIIHVLNLPKGSEIILPAYEDMSVPETIREAGMVPVFVDIDRRTQNLDLLKLKEKLTERTSAIVAAHIFGNPVDVLGIRAILGGRKIAIIEDCAHALGTRSSGKHVGNSGDIAFFSFNTTKPFSCFGGGMVVARNEAISHALRTYLEQLPCPRHFDLIKKIATGYFLFFMTSSFFFSLLVAPFLRFLNLMNVEPLGIYSKFFKRTSNKAKFVKFANAQALMGLRQLETLEKNVAIRRIHAQKLGALLRKEIRGVFLNEGCNYYFYIIFSKKREDFRRALLKSGLDSGKHLMRNCAALFKAGGQFSNTETAFDQSVQIPIHEKLSPRKIGEIAQVINKHFVC